MVEYSYTLGAAGERLKVVETDRTVEYEYDELYRLTKETVTDSNGTIVIEYTYDRNSNRLTKTVDGLGAASAKATEYAYNELNQLVSETGITYEYDLNGNLVKKTEGEQTTTYTYNAQNRLIRVTVQSGQQVNVEEYRYDYAGNRIAKIGELSTTYYLVDTNGALSQVLAEYDENGSLTTYYTRGEELISQERNGTKSYYLYDGFDSVRMLTDGDGSVTDTYTFDAFGNLTSSTGDTENSYLYRGEQFDSFTGLYYLRARYMNPSTGTFITMDEYAGSVFEPVSLHKYLYANANPVMFSDPSGYLSVSELSVSMAVQGIIGGIVSAGINILTFLNTAEPGEKFDWNNFWGSVLNGVIFGAGFGAVGTYAMAVQSVAIMTALGFSSLTFAAMSAIQSIEYGQEGEYELAITYWILTAIGLVGAAKSFNQAYQFSTARTTAATTTQNTASNTSCAKGDACFVGSTAVATEDGQKRIDEIEVGERVWAYNVETGETELKAVAKVYVHSVYEILHLYTDEGDIDTTSNHPFYVIGKGWVAAGDLVIGDKVYNLDRTTSTILSFEIEVLDEPVLVYNLEVEDLHSYFVGCVPVLVHNYMKTSDLTKIAKKLGYTKVNGEKSNGQAVYTNGKTYITYDVDAHNGGFWKMAKTVDGLRSKTTRMGTYDRHLNRIGD